MNNKGYILIYDAIIAIILLIIIITATLYMLEEHRIVFEDEDNYKKPEKMLITLSDTEYENGSLLSVLSYELDSGVNVDFTLNRINDMINCYDKHYSFSTTINNSTITLINNSSNSYKNIYSASYIQDNHTYTLKYYN